MDHLLGHHRYGWDADAISLDLDGSAARSLAAEHGLRNRSARDGPRTGDPSAIGHSYDHDWRRSRRNCGDLPLDSDSRRFTCHLAQVLFAEGRKHKRPPSDIRARTSACTNDENEQGYNFHFWLLDGKCSLESDARREKDGKKIGSSA